MNFVAVDSFDRYIDAHIMLGRLQEEGIKGWLKDENIVTINPLWTNAVGGIKLMVAQVHVEKALELITQFRQAKREFYSCVECGSNNIEHINPQKPVNWFVAILTWSFGSYALPAKMIWHCFECGAEFKQPMERVVEEE
jgi:DNA-directed RNA polymerase subunit RPC12/RpoP